MGRKEISNENCIYLDLSSILQRDMRKNENDEEQMKVVFKSLC